MPSRRYRWRRVAVVIAGLSVIIGGLAGIKFWQISTLIAVGKSMQASGPPPESVGSALAREDAWAIDVHAVGTVAGVESVAVTTQMPGEVIRYSFDSGKRVRKGQPLVEQDIRMETAQLTAAQARLVLATITAERTRKLVDRGAVPLQDLDRDESARIAAENDVKTVEAQIEHKIVRAPFDGRAGIRTINVGQFLPAGTAVTTVESTAGLWVDFTLPQEELARVHVGTPVGVSLRDQPPFAGTITAIDSRLDAATRSIRLRATLEDRNAPLRSGMFVTVDVILPVKQKAVVVPETAIVHAPYGDSVFVVEDKPAGSPGPAQTSDGKPVKIARQQFVQLGRTRGDFVAINKGLNAGTTVVAFGAFKLRNGSPIVVDNRVQPKLELEPHPQER